MYLPNEEFFEMKMKKGLIGFDFMMNDKLYPLAEQIIKEIAIVNKKSKEWYYTCKGVEGFTTWYFAYTNLEDAVNVGRILKEITENSGKPFNTPKGRFVERIVQKIAKECECPFKRDE